MKLVNIHKPIVIMLYLLVGTGPVAAQSYWSLEQCIDTALSHNKNLNITRNEIKSSRHRVEEAKAAMLPKLHLNADYKYFADLPTQLMPMDAFNPSAPKGQFLEAQFGVPHNINANLQLALPLYNSQILDAVKMAKTSTEIAELQFRKADEEIRTEITTLYYNAQILRNQIAFADSNLINTEKLHHNMHLLHRQQLAKATEVDKVQLQADQLKTQRMILAENYNQVMNTLKLIMGVNPATEIQVNPDIYIPAYNHYLRTTTTDYQLLMARGKILNRELQMLNKTRFLPSVNLVASYGKTGFGYGKSPDRFIDFYTVSFAGIQLNLPLFNGNITRKKEAQKSLEIANNELRAELLAESITLNIENADRRRETARQTITDTQKQAALAASIYNNTLLQQKEGTANLTDVLLADNALREAQQQYLSAVIEYLKADLELKNVTGNSLLNKKQSYEE